MFKKSFARVLRFVAGKEVQDNGQAFQALWWVARLTSILCIGMFFVILGLCAVIVSMFPLKEVQPMLVTAQDKSQQIIKIEPLEKGAKGWELVAHQLARQYVKERETIDGHTELARWRLLTLFSSQELDQQFRAQMDIENPLSPLKKFKDRGIQRKINIIRSTSLAPRAPDMWEVEWESVDIDSKELTETKAYWVSVLSVEFIEQEVKVEDQYCNPIGFRVTHYTVDNRQLGENQC
jgi:type IV secretion system protein VirB8